MNTSDRYSDETLRHRAEHGRGAGTQREAELLLTIPAELRRAAVAEAWYLESTIPGGRWSDHVAAALGRVRAGHVDSPAAADLLAEATR